MYFYLWSATVRISFVLISVFWLFQGGCQDRNEKDKETERTLILFRVELVVYSPVVTLVCTRAASVCMKPHLLVQFMLGCCTRKQLTELGTSAPFWCLCHSVPNPTFFSNLCASVSHVCKRNMWLIDFTAFNLPSQKTQGGTNPTLQTQQFHHSTFTQGKQL